MDGQLTIFDLLKPKEEQRFCFDDDINSIVNELDALTEKYKLKKIDAEFEIWEHVPTYGYRLSYDIGYKEQKSQEFYSDLAHIVDKWEKKNIELSPYDGTVKANDGYYHMDIYSTFKDSRTKIKPKQTKQKQPFIHNPCKVNSQNPCNHINLVWLARDLGMKCELECCYGCPEKTLCGVCCWQSRERK